MSELTTVSKSSLLGALSALKPFLSPKAPVQIAGIVDGPLRLRALSDSTLVTLFIPIVGGSLPDYWPDAILKDFSEPFEVNAAFLRRVLSGLSGKVTITVLDSLVRFSDGSRTYSIGRTEAVIPEDAEPWEPSLPDFEAGPLLGALRRTLPMASTDYHRLILTGPLVTFGDGYIEAVATDTHRLIVRRVPSVPTSVELPARVWPSAMARSLLSVAEPDTRLFLKSDDETLYLYGRGPFADFEIRSHPIKGSYPNWARVVPETFTRTWNVDSAALQEAVRAALITAAANRLRLRKEGDYLSITSRCEEFGDCETQVPVVGSNADLEIAFNGRYLLDAIAAIRCQGIRFEMTESSRSAKIVPVDNSLEENDRLFVVLMPMALA